MAGDVNAPMKLLPDASNPHAARVAGIALMLASIAFFSIGDVVGKFLVQDYPIGQFMLIRALISLALLAPFIWNAGWRAFAQMPRPGIQALRMGLSIGDIGLFFLAVRHLPLADVITFYLASPIYITAFSALFLGEKVGWRRWSAVIVGFVGVVIALDPSAATLTWPALVALAGSLCFTAFVLVTRAVRGTPDIVLTATHLVATGAFGGLVSAVNFVTPSPRHALLYLFGGVLSVGALLCINRSLKLAAASVVAPYQYTMILWAIALGYVFFDDVPSVATLVGCAIIVGAGLYIFMRERAMGRESVTAEAGAPPP